MSQLLAPVSIGEVFDKLSILEIKISKISDPTKLENLKFEKHELSKSVDSANIQNSDQLNDLKSQLKQINQKIWDHEDIVRECERQENFGKKFIKHARGIYHDNDQRAALKRKINELLGSTIIEEKSYAEYK